jgi:hypothetical protein
VLHQPLLCTVLKHAADRAGGGDHRCPSSDRVPSLYQ